VNEEALERLLDALERPEAPTTVHERDEARKVHIADSLVAVDALSDAGTICDLGSGAGIPGLVLAAALPSARVTLVESVGRKCEFIRATAAAMTVEVEVLHARAEEVRGTWDAVTARALAAMPVLCEYAAPLLRLGGRLVCWKGAVSESEEADGRAAAEVLGLGEPVVMPVKPFAESVSRTLWVFEKVAPTPPGFPRRPGMAAKRPLNVKSRV
jgi:16S rRNA (guanine527-N7)-methyltransferase